MTGEHGYVTFAQDANEVRFVGEVLDLEGGRTKSGEGYCNLLVRATTGDRTPVETTVWVRCYGERAEQAQLLGRGTRVDILGHLGNESWTGRDGVFRTRVVIKAHAVRAAEVER